MKAVHGMNPVIIGYSNSGRPIYEIAGGATSIGVNTLTSGTRQYIYPEVVDQVYRSNPAWFRLINSNKKSLQGGTQIEVPLFYQDFGAYTNYVGSDILNTDPQDVIKTGAWDWRQKAVGINIDGATLKKNDSPQSVFSIVKQYMEIARDKMADGLGVGVFSDAVSDPKELDGFRGAIDDGTVAGTYGGLSRTANTWWKSQIDTTTTTLSLTAIRSLFGKCTEGARHPTIIFTTQSNYNRIWVLTQPQQRFVTEPTRINEQLMQAGFTNIVFDNIPVVVDSHCTTAGQFASPNGGDHLYLVNEDYLDLVMMQGREIEMRDFVTPVNQDAFVSLLLFMGQMICKNPGRSGKMTALTS